MAKSNVKKTVKVTPTSPVKAPKDVNATLPSFESMEAASEYVKTLGNGFHTVLVNGIETFFAKCL